MTAPRHFAVLRQLNTGRADFTLKDACLQIRAGTGGDEAALFAADLLRMYQRYADAQSWKVAHLSESPGETGGLKEVIVQASPVVLLQEEGGERARLRVQPWHRGHQTSNDWCTAAAGVRA